MVNEEDDKTIYKVVLNHEGQYSIWPDMRPLSLRKKMDAMKQGNSSVT
jgi:uncharacterized protein YbdZ (MbtH family)